MTTKLYKAAEVCEMLQVQPFVLRSWEREFPAIGIQKGPDSPRLYRQSDVDQIQRIKQLVLGDGLTVAGARRRLEEAAPLVSAVTETEAAEVLEALGDDVRERIAVVRDGLRELKSLLSNRAGTSNGHTRSAKPAPRRAHAAKPASRKAAPAKARASSTRRAAARPKPAKRAASKAAPPRKKTSAKRKHARA